MAENNAEISLREVYDLLIDMRHELAGTPEDIKDHENRLRSLERKVWGAAGAAAVAGGGVAQLIGSWMGSS